MTGSVEPLQTTEVLVSTLKGYIYLLSNEWATLGEPEKKDLADMALTAVLEINRRLRDPEL